MGSGVAGEESLKLDAFAARLRGRPGDFFGLMRATWWKEEPTLAHALQKMARFPKVSLRLDAALQLFQQHKKQETAWMEHFMYSVAVSHAAGDQDVLVLESVV